MTDRRASQSGQSLIVSFATRRAFLPGIEVPASEETVGDRLNIDAIGLRIKIYRSPCCFNSMFFGYRQSARSLSLAARGSTRTFAVNLDDVGSLAHNASRAEGLTEVSVHLNQLWYSSFYIEDSMV